MIEGVQSFTASPNTDHRGSLTETWRADWGLPEFVQENEVTSRANVLRGIHFQPGLAKLVRCTRGSIWDVVVDLRPQSPTFRRWQHFYMPAEQRRQVLIPAGCGHGFLTLSREADVLYKLTDYYDPEREAAVRWDDPAFGIDWPIKKPTLSARDSRAPYLGNGPPLPE